MKFVDYPTAMSYLAGNEEIFKTVAMSFLESYRDFKELVDRSIYNKDYEGTHLLIHSLKGISLSLGFIPLYNVLIEMLIEIKEKNISSQLKERMYEIFDNTYQELQELI